MFCQSQIKDSFVNTEKVSDFLLFEFLEYKGKKEERPFLFHVFFFLKKTSLIFFHWAKMAKKHFLYYLQGTS